MVEAHAMVANFFSRDILSTSCSNDKRMLMVGRFDHKGLHQLKEELKYSVPILHGQVHLLTV